MKHVRLCTGDKNVRGHVSQSLHRLAVGDIHAKANEQFRKVVLRLISDGYFEIRFT